MSGFHTSWLDLREPADRLARDQSLLERAADHCRGREAVTLVDLGCGTGATFRVLAERLAARQSWRLVDHDEALLTLAAERVGKRAETQTFLADLGDVDQLPLGGADLVTASALFDLVSEAFIASLADRLARERVGLYAALSYDGMVEWSAPDPLDGPVVAAFNAHQQTDKGLGPALGPRAADRLTAHLKTRGFTVETARSPWRLDGRHDALQRVFLEGMASAVSQTGRIAAGEVQAWLQRRLEAVPQVSCRVGHLDVLALPA